MLWLQLSLFAVRVVVCFLVVGPFASDADRRYDLMTPDSLMNGLFDHHFRIFNFNSTQKTNDGQPLDQSISSQFLYLVEQSMIQ